MLREKSGAPSIFETLDYRQYLYTRLGAEGTRTGRRKRAAEAIQCHTTYLSQVMHGRQELSLEQAEGLNHFLSHSEEEADYFLLLVQFARAGSRALEHRIRKRIDAIQDKRALIQTRIPRNEAIPERDRERFYGHWLYPALHVLVSVPTLQTVDALARALKLPPAAIRDGLDFLRSIGLVVEEKGVFRMGPGHIHLRPDDPQTAHLHTNWRLHAIEAVRSPSRDPLADQHYSAIVTLSKSDAEKIKERFVKFLSETIGIIRESPTETAYVIGYDFYPFLEG